MLREDGIARRRHDVAPGRRLLFHDHHDGERRARICACAILALSAVARARRRLGDGRMGAILSRRTQGATPWAPRRFARASLGPAIPPSPRSATSAYTFGKSTAPTYEFAEARSLTAIFCEWL